MITEKEREFAELIFTSMYKAAKLEHIAESDAYFIAKRCCLSALEIEIQLRIEQNLDCLDILYNSKSFIDKL